jgi:hypothetical protein
MNREGKWRRRLNAEGLNAADAADLYPKGSIGRGVQAIGTMFKIGWRRLARESNRDSTTTGTSFSSARRLAKLKRPSTRKQRGIDGNFSDFSDSNFTESDICSVTDFQGIQGFYDDDENVTLADSDNTTGFFLPVIPGEADASLAKLESLDVAGQADAMGQAALNEKFQGNLFFGVCFLIFVAALHFALDMFVVVPYKAMVAAVEEKHEKLGAERPAHSFCFKIKRWIVGFVDAYKYPIPELSVILILYQGTTQSSAALMAEEGGSATKILATIIYFGFPIAFFLFVMYINFYLLVVHPRARWVPPASKKEKKNNDESKPVELDDLDEILVPADEQNEADAAESSSAEPATLHVTYEEQTAARPGQHLSKLAEKALEDDDEEEDEEDEEGHWEDIYEDDFVERFGMLFVDFKGPRNAAAMKVIDIFRMLLAGTVISILIGEPMSTQQTALIFGIQLIQFVLEVAFRPDVDPHETILAVLGMAAELVPLGLCLIPSDGLDCGKLPITMQLAVLGVAMISIVQRILTLLWGLGPQVYELIMLCIRVCCFAKQKAKDLKEASVHHMALRNAKKKASAPLARRPSASAPTAASSSSAAASSSVSFAPATPAASHSEVTIRSDFPSPSEHMRNFLDDGLTVDEQREQERQQARDGTEPAKIRMDISPKM